MQLSFGEVPVGNLGIMEFELSNTSSDFCLVTRVGLDPASDPAFSLPDGGLRSLILSFPGNANNPAGLPSSLILQAEFAPTTPEAAAAGKIDVTSLNTVPPEQSISLIAVSQAACLSIQPASFDFGLVGFSATTQQICLPAGASLLASNDCATPVTVNQIAINSGLSAAPQFSLENSPQLPLTLAPGGQAGVDVDFVPTSAGGKLGAITVSSSEFPNAPFLITLQGDAELSGTRTDTFIMPPLAKKVDLLWILDEDDDAVQVANVSNLLPQLIDTMNQDQLDYQIAVTSTDTCDAGSSDQGFLEPCEHCLSTARADPTFITPATNAATTLLDFFGNFDVAPQEGLCTGVNGDEHFFDSIADAFAPDLLSGHNSGFIRDGAYLAIVLVNGDGEDDAEGGGAGGPYLTSLAQVTSLVQSLKPDPSMVSVSYINSGAGTLNLGQKIGQLVAATGGIEIDTNAQAAVWQASLLNLFAFTEGTGTFHLTSTPASASQIQVAVNGVPVAAWMFDPFTEGAWTYDATTNNVVFVAGQLPAPGSVVTVTYELGCP